MLNYCNYFFIPLFIAGNTSVHLNYKGICPLHNLSKYPICIFPSVVDISCLSQLNRENTMPIEECVDYRVPETVGSLTGVMVTTNYLFSVKWKFMIFNSFLSTNICFCRSEGAETLNVSNADKALCKSDRWPSKQVWEACGQMQVQCLMWTMMKVHTIFYGDFKDDHSASLKYFQYASVRTLLPMWKWRPWWNG